MSALNYSFVFDFERNFEQDSMKQWVQDHYYLPFYVIVVYVVVIFGLQKVMEERKPFDLRKYLFLWNASLAIFSLCGSLRAIPTLYDELRDFGFVHSVCDNSNVSSVAAFWGWLFAASKFPELGDTLFIVLRKQKLIFLHWYHHVTVLVICWMAYAETIAAARWMATMNYSIHFVMYTYYTFRAIRYRIPAYISMSITVIQILQMVVGVYVSIYIYVTKHRGLKCDISENLANFLLAVYASYFVLFVHYFYQTYTKPALKKERKVQ